MDSRPTTLEREAALDHAIDVARDGQAPPGGGDELDEFAARLHGFASSGPAIDETRIRRMLEAKLDTTPQHQSWLRLPSWFAMPAISRGFAPAAVAVVVALLIGVGALMSTSGNASADFMEDVQELSAFTTTAIADGELDDTEFASITELVGALLVAVSDPDALSGIEPEALATVVETLAAVQAVLEEHGDGIGGDDGAGGDLELVSGAVLQAHASGLIGAAGEACTGEDADQEACKQAFDDAKEGCRELSGSDRGACRSELGGAALGAVGSTDLEDADMSAAQAALDAFLAVLDEQTDLAEGGLIDLTTAIGDWQTAIDTALASALALIVEAPVIDPDSIATRDDAEALQDELDALRDDLDGAREALEDAFEPMLDDLDGALDALFEEADGAVEEAAEPFDDDYRVYRDDVKAYITDFHLLLKELREDALAQRDAVKDAIEAARDELSEAIDAAKQALDDAKAELKLLKKGLPGGEDDDEGADGEGLEAKAGEHEGDADDEGDGDHEGDGDGEGDEQSKGEKPEDDDESKGGKPEGDDGDKGKGGENSSDQGLGGEASD